MSMKDLTFQDDNTIKTKGGKVLGIIGSSVEPMDKVNQDTSQLWKKGPQKLFFKKKYFQIINIYNQKVLSTGEEDGSLKIRGKCHY